MSTGSTKVSVSQKVAIIARAGKPFGRNPSSLGSRAGLQHVDQRESNHLLQSRVALDFHVGGAPKLVEVAALLGGQPLPAGISGRRQRCLHLIIQSWKRPQ